MEQRYGTDPSRRYGTGVWIGGMEWVWSRSLFRTSYFDLHPYIYICIIIYYIKYISLYLYVCHSGRKFPISITWSEALGSLRLTPAQTAQTRCPTREPRYRWPKRRCCPESSAWWKWRPRIRRTRSRKRMEVDGSWWKLMEVDGRWDNFYDLL